MKVISKIITANRLIDGEVVWLGANGWVETIEAALVHDDPPALETSMETAMRSIAGNLVVDVDVIDVTREGSEIVPVRLREKIRAMGPTFRGDLGKQADRSVRASDAA